MMHQMKFMLWKKNDLGGGNIILDFQAQYDENILEDRKFSDYTPNGTVTLTVKPIVAEQYEVGKNYYFYSDKAE